MTTPLPWPTTAGELLRHLELVGDADQWRISTEPSDMRDQCGTVRRIFWPAWMNTESCRLVCDYGEIFVAVGDMEVLLRDLWTPEPLLEVIAGKRWCTPAMLGFLQALERVFPYDLSAGTTTTD